MLIPIAILSILLNSFFYKTIRIPTIIFFVSISISKIFLSKKVPIGTYYILFLFLAYNAVLALTTFYNVDYPRITTNIYTDPIIPEYISVKQIVLGFIYNNIPFIYFFLLYPIVYNRYFSLKKIEKTLYLFGFINSLIVLFEILNSNLHIYLMQMAGYEKIHYFFVKRPVGIVLNSYVNAFICSFFSFLSFYYYLNSKKIFMKLFYFILFLFGFLTTILSGARYAIILLILSLLVYVFLQRKIQILFWILILNLFIFILIYLYDSNYIFLILSLITLEDPAGSANLHKLLFLYSFKLVLQYPLGLGIGKADFGALNTVPKLAFDPESYILSLLIGGGWLSLFLYLSIYILALKNLIKLKKYHLAAFMISILFSAIINIQVMQSLTGSVVITFILLNAFSKSYKNFKMKGG